MSRFTFKTAEIMKGWKQDFEEEKGARNVLKALYKIKQRLKEEGSIDEHTMQRILEEPKKSWGINDASEKRNPGRTYCFLMNVCEIFYRQPNEDDIDYNWVRSFATECVANKYTAKEAVGAIKKLVDAKEFDHTEWVKRIFKHFLSGSEYKFKLVSSGSAYKFDELQVNTK